MKHNYSAYVTNLCRCDKCKASWAEYWRDYRQRRKQNQDRRHRHIGRRHGKSRVMCKFCGKTTTAELAAAEWR